MKQNSNLLTLLPLFSIPSPQGIPFRAVARTASKHWRPALDTLAAQPTDTELPPLSDRMAFFQRCQEMEQARPRRWVRHYVYCIHAGLAAASTMGMLSSRKFWIAQSQHFSLRDHPWWHPGEGVHYSHPSQTPPFSCSLMRGRAVPPFAPPWLGILHLPMTLSWGCH